MTRELNSEPSPYVNLPSHPETDPLTRYEQKVNRRERSDPRRGRVKRMIGGVAIATALTSNYLVHAGSNYLANEVALGREVVEDNHAQIHEVVKYDGSDEAYSVHGTFVLTGLGTKDPTGTAEILYPHHDTGDVFALEYSNHSLDTVDMAKRVIEQAKKSDLKEITFDGYSAGGPIALDIAAYIHKNEPDLHITSVVLNSSPIGEGGLTDQSRRGVEVMNAVLSIYPDFIYYEDGRALIEVINRHERYILSEEHSPDTQYGQHNFKQIKIRDKIYSLDIDQLRWEIDDIREKMKDPSVASASLIKSQADFITMTDYDSNIRTLARPGANKVNDTPPLIVFTRSQIASEDQVVDVEDSERNIVKSLASHNASYTIVHGDVGHANPNERRDQYYQMIESKINPRITGRLALGMRKYKVEDRRLAQEAKERIEVKPGLGDMAAEMPSPEVSIPDAPETEELDVVEDSSLGS